MYGCSAAGAHCPLTISACCPAEVCDKGLLDLSEVKRKHNPIAPEHILSHAYIPDQAAHSQLVGPLLYHQVDPLLSGHRSRISSTISIAAVYLEMLFILSMARDDQAPRSLPPSKPSSVLTSCHALHQVHLDRCDSGILWQEEPVTCIEFDILVPCADRAGTQLVSNACHILWDCLRLTHTRWTRAC